jgi:hypothetical protein
MAIVLNGRSNTCTDIMSQNLRGFKEETEEEEIILRMVQRNLSAATPQGTWRIGNNTWEIGGLTFIHHGLSEKPCKRGAHGFAIVLSLEARKARERAGSKSIYFGPRILATRLRLHGTSRRRPLPCSSCVRMRPTAANRRLDTKNTPTLFGDAL